VKTRGKTGVSRIGARDENQLGALLDRSPTLVVLAGSNGAGKTTFYHAHLKSAGLRFLNADDISRELGINPYEGASIVTGLRRELVKRKVSFVFETVFSDPVGDKLAFLKETAESGYTVILCFIGLASAAKSDERVTMRVTQGGHNVAPEKLIARFPRTLANLKAAIVQLPHVLVFDNDDLQSPFRHIATFQQGCPFWLATRPPRWFENLI
jgi:predicted ABC-type ATPase